MTTVLAALSGPHPGLLTALSGERTSLLAANAEETERLLADDPIWLIILKVVALFAIGVLLTLFMINWERKVVGRIQNRWGPSRVGPFGLLHPLVDGAKSFLKEDLIPTAVYRPLYLLAPMIALGCALISIGVVPFGEPGIGPGGFDLFQIANVNIGPSGAVEQA